MSIVRNRAIYIQAVAYYHRRQIFRFNSDTPNSFHPLRDNLVLEQQMTTGKDTIAKDLEKQMDKNQQSQTK